MKSVGISEPIKEPTEFRSEIKREILCKAQVSAVTKGDGQAVDIGISISKLAQECFYYVQTR